MRPFGKGPRLNQPRRGSMPKAGQPVNFTSGKRTVEGPITRSLNQPYEYSSEAYSPVDDVHSITEAPNSTKEKIVIAKWNKEIKKETPTARKKGPPPKAKK